MKNFGTTVAAAAGNGAMAQVLLLVTMISTLATSSSRVHVHVAAFLPHNQNHHRLVLNDDKNRVLLPLPAKQKQMMTRRSFVLQSNNDRNDNDNDHGSDEPIFYNDFDDFFPSGEDQGSIIDSSPIESSPSPSSPSPSSPVSNDNDNDNPFNSQLSKLLSKSKQKDVDKDMRLGRNWSSGNWKVRGFSLDKYEHEYSPSEVNEVNKDSEGSGGLGARERSGRKSLQQKFANLRKVGNNTDANTNFNTNTDTDEMDPLAVSPQPQPVQEQTIHVCKIAFDETVLGFNDVTETIAVGRTDGSVYIIQLGSDYLTRFQATSVSTTSDDDSSNDSYDDDDDFDPLSYLSSPSTKRTEMVREDAANQQQQQYGDTEGEGGTKSTMSSEELLSTPFEIVHQFYTNDNNEPITSLLFHDETLYTASGSSGEIKVWSFDDSLAATDKINDDDINNVNLIPVQNLCNAHSDTVVVMKTLSNAAGNSEEKVGVNDHNLLLTASIDGSFALWSRDSGDLVYRCNLVDDSGIPTSITCADVDTTSDEHFVYFGLSSGHVVGYAVSDIVGSASVGNECPVPSCRFIAHDPSQQKNVDKSKYSGITSIACAGEGTSALISKSMSPSSNVRSSMLLTGGADGIVKQYEILRHKFDNLEEGTRRSDSSPLWKLEHWPRLSTQRMKRHAHIFNGHHGSVTALASQQGSKILSAGDDGTVRVWCQSQGIELYRMDGFEETVSSLCLDREILITDGMGAFVCVHDFDITSDDYENSFDLDW